jgi:hypothetical protein
MNCKNCIHFNVCEKAKNPENYAFQKCKDFKENYMTCKQCIHYEVCPLGLAVNGETGTCLRFKNKADFVEVVHCKDCVYWDARITTGRCEGIRNGLMYDYTDEGDFCSYGEREENGKSND